MTSRAAVNAAGLPPRPRVEAPDASPDATRKSTCGCSRETPRDFRREQFGAGELSLAGARIFPHPFPGVAARRRRGLMFPLARVNFYYLSLF